MVANGELRLTLGRDDAADTERLDGGVPRVTLAILNIDWQTLADALSLGGIYALMAVGIGLVFGVLRLVNFAYGQLVMAGAYALAYGSQWNLPRRRLDPLLLRRRARAVVADGPSSSSGRCAASRRR